MLCLWHVWRNAYHGWVWLDEFLLIWLLPYVCFNFIYPLLKLQEILGSDLGSRAENVAQIQKLQAENSLFGPEPLPCQGYPMVLGSRAATLPLYARGSTLKGLEINPPLGNRVWEGWVTFSGCQCCSVRRVFGVPLSSTSLRSSRRLNLLLLASCHMFTPTGRLHGKIWEDSVT